MELSQFVGQRLKESRLSNGLTQREVAEKLNILQPAYARFENGKFELNYHQLITLCKLFNVSADYLLGLSEIE